MTDADNNDNNPSVNIEETLKTFDERLNKLADTFSQSMEATNQNMQAIGQAIVQSQATPTTVETPEEIDMYDPNQVNKLIDDKVNQRVAQSQKKEQELRSVLNQMNAEYPEMNDSDVVYDL